MPTNPYAGVFPGMMTEGIDSPETSIFRGLLRIGYGLSTIC